jgi:ubiquinone/menaquinone biosynthesis C-methylase UbiE
VVAVPDMWAMVSRLDAATQRRLAGVLETRGADEQQQRMREAFLAEIELPDGARVLDVGCGTGVLTRRLGGWPGVGSVVGVDLARVLLARARALCDLRHVEFREGDATALPFEEAEFDAVVLDSTLSHVSDTARAVSEAGRVLRPGGLLAVFDGDYSTTTVALGDHDPLQVCVDAMVTGSVTYRFVVRRLPAMVRTQGFAVRSYTEHSYVGSGGAEYLLTLVDRGADLLLAEDRISAELAAALQAEARARVAAGRFFGRISYASLVAALPE